MPQVQLPVLPALFRDQTWHIQQLTHRVPSLLQSPADDSSISLTASSEEFGLACFEFVISSTSFCCSCDLEEEEGAAWHQPAQLLRVQKVQQDGDGYPIMHGEVLVGHQGCSSQMAANWPSPAWLFLGENTLQKPHVSGHSGWDLPQAPALLCAVMQKALSLAVAVSQGWKDIWTLSPG